MCATRALESYDRRRQFQYQLLPIAQVPLGGPDQTLSETRWIRAGLRHVRRLTGRVGSGPRPSESATCPARLYRWLGPVVSFVNCTTLTHGLCL